MLIEKEFNEHQLAKTAEQATASPAVPNQSNFISIKDNKVIYRIPHEDINYIQSWGNYLKFFLRDKDIKIVRKTIKVVESELPADQFLRIHKSYIVNINHIISIEGNQIKFEDQELPIGKSYVVNVKKTITG